MACLADRGDEQPKRPSNPEINPETARTIADYLIGEMLRLACPFDLRLLVNKAFPDYQQWKDREVESDWRDLITASIEEHLVAVKHPEELWFVNTRFSCLCTRGMPYSFVPRWRRSFVTELAPEDRCHLNGLGLRDGRVRYVTALGETNTPGGWRANEKDGGVLIDLEANEVIARGLSMPHSPRWYAGRLWVLHSGTGGLGTIDPATGRYEEVATLPGFTRWLDFAGPLAFVGLSQVRESAVFSGIPITDRPLEERSCGVWVVNIQTGQVVALVRFEDALQEIFAVQLLPGRRRPDVLNDDTVRLADSFVVPDDALAEVAEPFRKFATPRAAG